jgi:transcription initiation factor TFIID subunit TAF12
LKRLLIMSTWQQQQQQQQQQQWQRTRIVHVMITKVHSSVNRPRTRTSAHVAANKLYSAGTDSARAKASLAENAYAMLFFCII